MNKIVITGACGFIGTCLSLRMMADGYQVIGIDNLSRPGSELNFHELSASPSFSLHRADVSDAHKLNDVFARLGDIEGIFHMAAQVAVTTSYQDRRRDFLDNAVGTFNVMEAAKQYTPGAYCLYASTNKVYGHIQVDTPVGEDYPLNPYTPYGASKAAGDLYVMEYGSRELGLATCVLRQSCIYGHHQFGIEDQGWIAWFAVANYFGLPVTLFGDGTQIRDLLFVDDLVDLYVRLFTARHTGAHPVGGGIENALSLNEGLDMIRSVTGKDFVQISYQEPRPGDQPYFVADNAWARRDGIDWTPGTGVRPGIEFMIGWIRENQALFRHVYSLPD